MTLEEATNGSICKITGINGNAHLHNRLTAIGLTVGSTVQILKKQKNMPLLLFCRDTKIALGRSVCKKIIVEALP